MDPALNIIMPILMLSLRPILLNAAYIAHCSMPPAVPDSRVLSAAGTEAPTVTSPVDELMPQSAPLTLLLKLAPLSKISRMFAGLAGFVDANRSVSSASARPCSSSAATASSRYLSLLFIMDSPLPRGSTADHGQPASGHLRLILGLAYGQPDAFAHDRLRAGHRIRHRSGEVPLRHVVPGGGARTKGGFETAGCAVRHQRDPSRAQRNRDRHVVFRDPVLVHV